MKPPPGAHLYKLELRLDRFFVGTRATLGRLFYPGGSCYTLEDPWRDNRRGESCIPEGRYALKMDTFKGRYPNLRLLCVPGRDAIEVHRGNTVRDTQGCILVGRRVVLMEDGMPTLQESTAALAALLAATDGFGELELFIRVGGEP